MTHQATDWMARAACRMSPLWTPEHKPRPNLLAALREVCDHCPVQPECAAFALAENAHGGVYAGVWLSDRTCPEWLHARRILHHKTRPVATRGPK